MLSPIDLNSKRIEMINTFSCTEYRALIKTHIYMEKDLYIYKQALLSKKKLPTKLVKQDFKHIALALDYFESINFVHGDINRKNIIYTLDGFKIIDYEPSLHQVKNGVNQLMVTMPYVIKEDLYNHELTTLTDKIGFIYFILRVTKQMKSIDVVKLSKTLDHESYLNIKLKNIKKLSYTKLLEICFNDLLAAC